jgi:hypothetical protein
MRLTTFAGRANAVYHIRLDAEQFGKYGNDQTRLAIFYASQNNSFGWVDQC